MATPLRGSFQLIIDGQELICSICLELLTDPRNLPCEHIFCLQCLLKSTEKKCPACLEDTIPETEAEKKDLPSNEGANEIVKKYIRKGRA